ncbi:MAG: tyrosine-protein phosphatase [Pseudomonadales bacterium]|jgi:protein-tyrosine phosphatase|nr:tyrosine-protein phosphatase [Pseudomonadales bacterium]
MRRAAIVLVPALLAACGEQAAQAPNVEAPPAPVAARIVEAAAARDALDGPVTLSWTVEPAGAAVDVLVGASPDMPLEAMELLGDDLTSGNFEADVEGRRYFALRTDEGSVVRTAVRVLPLEGGRNFRDLGGYTTVDGRRVRWGKVFRSGTMVDLTEADYGYLDAIDAQVLVDFRSSEERADEPTNWQVDEPEYWARDYSSETDSGAFRELFASGEITAEKTRAVMTGMYDQIALQQADAYRVMFDRLAAGETPLVFNCSAGKDRTGIAAALLLTALGVPRDQVVADYALSDDVVDYSAAFLETDEGDDSPYAFMRQFPREAIMPLLASEPEYIEAALQGLADEYGSVMAFIRGELDVTEDELDAIRASLLEG